MAAISEVRNVLHQIMQKIVLKNSGTKMDYVCDYFCLK